MGFRNLFVRGALLKLPNKGNVKCNKLRLIKGMSFVFFLFSFKSIKFLEIHSRTQTTLSIM